MTQIELIKLVLDGNQEAFRSIVEQYKANVFRTCLGFVHSREDAEELTQDVFVNIYHNLDRFKGDSTFSTWIYRIAVNSSLNHLRKQKKFSFIQRFENIFGGEIHENNNAAIKYSDSPEKLMIDEERNNQLYKAIDSLPENQRIAFTLSKYEDMPQREIAGIMNLTEGAVEALLQRAKANLQKKLSGYIKKKKQPVGIFNN
jgi:RNA polymerase sigma-70 factor (ECF subfamily)